MPDRPWAFKARDWCPANPATTDCSPGLQDLFNTAPAHSRVLFKNGTYLMSSGVTITKPMIVQCESMSACLFDANFGVATTPVFTISGVGHGFWQHGAVDRDDRTGPAFELDTVEHFQLIRAAMIRADPYVAVRARSGACEDVVIAMCRGTLARARGLRVGDTADANPCDLVSSCFNDWVSDTTRGSPSYGEEWVKGDLHLTQGGVRRNWNVGVFRQTGALHYLSDGGWCETCSDDYNGTGVGCLIGQDSWASGLDTNRWYSFGPTGS